MLGPGHELCFLSHLRVFFSPTPLLYLVWTKEVAWPLREVTQASHKMLVFAILILWEATDQRFRGVWDACLQTWRGTCETGIVCPRVCRSCFPEPCQKRPCWDWHLLFLFCVSVYGPSSLNQCSKCFRSTCTKGFSFRSPARVCDSHMVAITCVIFCLLIWVQKCIFSWSDTMVTLFLQRLQWGKNSPFSILFQIARHGFSVWELITPTLQDHSLPI